MKTEAQRLLTPRRGNRWRLRVKELAEARGMNITQVSARSGVSRKTVTRLWNNPKSSTLLSTIDKLARAFGTNINDLIVSLDEQEEREKRLLDEGRISRYNGVYT
ncbi:MAG: helix-turn-helix transcriptional regulator [Ktedonobacteraceae bacterium]|nr:helix-turn-helix transcriptional regulator [Ktedonobacteraceae bacterium]